MKHLSHAYFNTEQAPKTGEAGLLMSNSKITQKDPASLFWGGGLIIISYIVTIAGTIVFLKLVYCIIKERCLKFKNDDKKCEC